jgi:hypothetical protein
MSSIAVRAISPETLIVSPARMAKARTATLSFASILIAFSGLASHH